MKFNLSLSRRTMLALAMGLTLGTTAVNAADYPSDRITFICAFPAGSGADVLVRYFGHKLSDSIGQTVIVENKPGANGNIAAEYVARSKPDGYTLYVHSGTSVAGNMSLFKNPPIDVTKDLRGVQFINKQAFVIAVPTASTAQNIDELTAMMKEKGDKGTYGITATSGKVLGAYYRKVADIVPTEVQYRTGPEMVNDLVPETIDFAVLDPVFALAQQNGGRIRILAVASPEPMPAMPGVPTLKEAGYDIDQLGWWGVFAPAGTPDETVNILNEHLGKILAQPDTIKFLQDNGGEVFVGTPKEVDDLTAFTVEEWRGYVEEVGIPQN